MSTDGASGPAGERDPATAIVHGPLGREMLRFGAPIAQGAYALGAIGIMLAIVLLAPYLRKLE